MNKRHIQICDNSIKQLSEDELCNLSTLKQLAKPTISELILKEHPNLLIFPKDLDVYGDKIGDSHLFTVNDNKIITGNIMGYIGCGDTKISIKSRFTKDDKDYFLHYLLQKVFSVNLVDFKFNSDNESIFDFLIYLFPPFLKRALQQGVYKEYQTRYYNDTNIKGRIDIPRHIRQNVPFIGKVAYTTREYAYDNHVTQLIRHTIEYISSHPLSENILYNGEDIIEAVKDIYEVTPTYNPSQCQWIINQNLRPISHPYFSEYSSLQQLCLQILRQEKIKYGNDDDEVYGVLFDGAWLWEEYLSTFLTPHGFEHPRNKEYQGKKYLFDDNTGWCYPDFLSKHIVLDAKYKGYSDWSKVQSADLYQLISYMHVFDKERGGFIVPIKYNSKSKMHKSLNGLGGSIDIFGMKVDFQTDEYRDYCKLMRESEKDIRERIMVNKTIE